MAYPEKPVLSTSYTAVEQAQADGTFPGQELDVDLAALKASIEVLNDFLRGVTRSDGGLANGIVRRENLAGDVLLGFDAPATWAPTIAYSTSNTVFQGAAFYICVVAHTSGVSFSDDLSAGRWELLFDLSGTGTLVAANNLSDVADAPTALQNLELTATAAEINHMDGVTAPVQGQLDDLASDIGTAASDIGTVASDTTDALATKAALAGATFTGAVTIPDLTGTGPVDLSGATVTLPASVAGGGSTFQPLSKSGTGVGQLKILSPGVGFGLQLDPDWTWEYYATRYNNGVAVTVTGGVAEGGAVVGASAGGQNWIARVKRIQ